MLWVFFALTLMAIAGLVAYIRLGKEVWQRQQCVRKPDKWAGENVGIPPEENYISLKAETGRYSFGWPDLMVCLVLGIYFLALAASPSKNNQIPTLREIEVGAVFYVLLDLLIFTFLILRHIHPVKVFGLRAMCGFRVFKSAVLWLIALYPLIFLVQLLVESLAGTNVAPQPLVQYLIDNKRLSDHLIVGLLAVIIAPCTEELIFRGYLYGVLRQYAGRLVAIIVTSCIFAGIHQHLPAFPGLFLLAVALCLVYEATGSLTVAMVMHALFNLIGVLAAIFQPFHP